MARAGLSTGMVVFSQPGAVRWGWDHVVPVLSDPDVVVGTVGFEDPKDNRTVNVMRFV